MSLPAILLKPVPLLLIALVLGNLTLLFTQWMASSRAPESRVPETSTGPGSDDPAKTVAAASGTAEVWLLSERQSPSVDAGPRGGESAELQPLPGSDPPSGSEASVAAEADAAEPADPTTETPGSPGAAGGPVCRIWGPFADEADLQAMVDKLGLLEGDFRVDRSDIPAATDYLVYIAHGGDRDAARRLLLELRSLGVEGYIMGGRFSNALSVGVFSSEARALKQQATVAAMGYAADIETLERTQQVYHLLARVEPGSVDLGGQNRPCSDIAQAP